MALARRFQIVPIWAGKTAIIIGGGPSLTLKQIRAVAIARHKASSPFRVMTVNDAIFAAWFTDWQHAGDTQWWQWHIQSVHTNPCTKTTLAEDVPDPWVSGYLENTGPDGFDEDPTRCRSGASSVYQAICISMHLGVKRIVLLGVDMKRADDGTKHWFGDHPGHFGRVMVDYQTAMAPHFETLKPALVSKGVDVINASPGTALAAFPLNDLEAELNRI